MRINNRLTPFLIAGIMIVVMAFGLVLLAYLILIGTLVGIVLFVANWIRDRFFAPKKKVAPQQPSGRIIDSDDWRKL